MNAIGPILLVVLALAALAAFAWQTGRIALAIARAPASPLGTSAGEKLRELLLVGFGQRKVLFFAAGIFHAFIFYGFFVLGVHVVESFGQEFARGFDLAGVFGPLYPAVNTTIELLSLLILVAIAASLYRREIMRPLRLSEKREARRDAFVILGLVAVIVLAGMVQRGGAALPGWMPASRLLSGIAQAVLGALALPGARWVHNLAILAFLAYIPHSKHTHVVAGLPNLFFHAGRPLGKMRFVDLAREDADHFGKVHLADLDRKDLLDLFACTECGRCSEACPATRTGKLLRPDQIIRRQKDFVLAHLPAMLARTAHGDDHRIVPGAIPAQELWECTNCNACEEVCPVDIRIMSHIQDLRQGQILTDGAMPDSLEATQRQLEQAGNPWGYPAEERDAWVGDLPVPRIGEGVAEAEYLYFVGCAGSYDDRYRKAARAFAALMLRAGVKFAILGKGEICNGDPARRAGNDYLAQDLLQRSAEAVRATGLKKVVATCPHCLNALRHDFAAVGVELEVVHHTELLGRLVAEGRLVARSMSETDGGARGIGGTADRARDDRAKMVDGADVARQSGGKTTEGASADAVAAMGGAAAGAGVAPVRVVPPPTGGGAISLDDPATRTRVQAEAGRAYGMMRAVSSGAGARADSAASATDRDPRVITGDGATPPAGGEHRAAPDGAGAVAYHDSCFLARYHGIASAPRAVLDAAGAQVREMDHRGRATVCCGAGGGHMFLEETPGTAPVARLRLAEAASTGAAVLATACPFCMNMLESSREAEGCGHIDVRDIAEILWDAVRRSEAAADGGPRAASRAADPPSARSEDDAGRVAAPPSSKPRDVSGGGAEESSAPGLEPRPGAD